MNALTSTAEPTATVAWPDLVAALLMHATDNPEAPAVVHGSSTTTYEKFAGDAQRLAASLSDLGVTAGDRIVLHLGNCVEAAIGCYAAMMLGAIAVPMNVHLKPHEVGRLMQRLQPAAYFGHPAQRGVMDEIATNLLPVTRRFYVDDRPAAQFAKRDDGHAGNTWHALVANAREGRSFPAGDPDAVAVLLCTSGSTGEPKLVAHTRRALGHMVHYMHESGFGRNTKPLVPTPLFHLPGYAVLCAVISTGACVALPLCVDFDGDAFLDAIEQHRCTNTAVTPYGAAEMIRAQQARRRVTDSLHLCVVAGDACSIDLQQRFEQTFGVELVCRYGMTEAPLGVLSGRTSRTMRARAGMARVIDRDGNDVSAGTPGELCLNVPTLLKGYWIAPDKFDSARDADGWYHTGDLVREDEDGDLHYLARIKEIIVRDGENIAPAEIEQTLLSHPAAADAAIVGVPDEVLGERIVGFVKLADHARGMREQAIIAWLAARLADHKLPETIFLVDSIPRTPFGKADRRALRALASTEFARQRGMLADTPAAPSRT
ncbi:class I adenylate-forming enzyme family protein [Paraburkholderia solisilvae]|uniref:Long-chain-fatty-acid--CoA ligase n=1 Tax=Paraburkholderia solisilvae TaxID=624376 RepID=A0A6J5EMA9_9BURK|nr:class I adenylate-forming enzyme family protein [Paraburkholderia solisilvae]CAB3766631.1 Long-chain-fatty-acid--CoA ligase [Paraburkholderia solisilvae]